MKTIFGGESAGRAVRIADKKATGAMPPVARNCRREMVIFIERPSLGNPCLLEEHGLPSAVALHVNAGKANWTTHVFAINSTFGITAPGDYSGIAVDLHLQIIDVIRLKVYGAGFDGVHGVSLAAHSAVGVDQLVIVGGHFLQCGCVFLDDGLSTVFLHLLERSLSVAASFGR